MDQLLMAIRAMRRDLGLMASSHAAYMHVTFDDRHVWLRSTEADGEHRVRARFAWTSIRRVCFKDNGPMASDKVYVIADDRTFVVPLEAVGGGDFWRQLRVRGVVPPELHEVATLSMDGGLYCWPPVGKDASTAPETAIPPAQRWR